MDSTQVVLSLLVHLEACETPVEGGGGGTTLISNYIQGTSRHNVGCCMHAAKINNTGTHPAGINQKICDAAMDLTDL